MRRLYRAFIYVVYGAVDVIKALVVIIAGITLFLGPLNGPVEWAAGKTNAFVAVVLYVVYVLLLATCLLALWDKIKGQGNSAEL